MKISKKYIIILLLIIVSIISILLLILKYSNIFENYENNNDTNDNNDNDNDNDNVSLPLPYDIVIVGCARDIESYLTNTKKKLEMVKSLFRSSKIIIYENDSKDKTLEILSTWNKEKFIKLITEKNVKGIRTERLAYARNLLYKEAMKSKFDLLIVIDLDNVINDLTPESIMSCFNKELIDKNWAMLGANQTGNYYDMFALKTYNDWMDIDLMKCRHIDKLPENFCLTDRYKNIPKNNKPIQVKSCFGGIAIYKRQYLDNCDYGKGFQMNVDEKIEFCEHVDFNECVIKNGGKIYINPKFINH
jgi:hypothetical protein